MAASASSTEEGRLASPGAVFYSCSVLPSVLSSLSVSSVYGTTTVSHPPGIQSDIPEKLLLA